MKRLWDKGKPVDELVLDFCVGEDHILDERLVAHDIRASRAHATMLAEQGLISKQDHAAIDGGLAALAQEHEQGLWSIAKAEEDGHTAIERRLTERIGEAGARIHLGRSRNDQVLAALRLWMIETGEELARAAESVSAALHALGERQGATPLPGYTHMQRAMPSSVALWAGGFAAEIEDDAEGIRQALRRARKCPLGSAAGYGVPVVTLDRARTAELLGFDEVHEPVTAVQLSRGKAEAAVLFEVVLLMQDLGRLAADVVLFATREFGFVHLADAFTTGSSIMPQKRNPDVFELVRGRATSAKANLDAAFALTAKLPSGYHRDLQLIKPPLMEGLDDALATSRVVAHALTGLTFEEDLCRAAMTPELYATERALRLVVDDNLPFREAYRRIAKDS